MFIVQGKPRSPEGILKVIKQTRHEAMHAANDLLAGRHGLCDHHRGGPRLHG